MMGAHNLPRATFIAKQADVLFWTANLIHGGEKIRRRRTRRSLVTHYCPLSATVPYARHLGLQPRHLAQGGWVLSQT